MIVRFFFNSCVMSIRMSNLPFFFSSPTNRAKYISSISSGTKKDLLHLSSASHGHNGGKGVLEISDKAGHVFPCG